MLSPFAQVFVVVLPEVIAEMVLAVERLAILSGTLAVVAVVCVLLAVGQMPLLVMSVQVRVALEGLGRAFGSETNVAVFLGLFGGAVSSQPRRSWSSDASELYYLG